MTTKSFILACLALTFAQSHQTMVDLVLQNPFEPFRQELRNASQQTTDQFGSLAHLFERQTCAAGYSYCASEYKHIQDRTCLCTVEYGGCCLIGERCCAGGCVPSNAARCCSDNLHYCLEGEYCCGPSRCMPDTADCCGGGYYCPAPSECITLYSNGQTVCCTDTSCTVYLADDGTTSTLTSTARTTYRTTETYSATQITRTTATRSFTEYEYYTYYSTIYWYVIS